MADRIELGLRDRAHRIIEDQPGESALGRVERHELSPAAAAQQLLASLIPDNPPED